MSSGLVRMERPPFSEAQVTLRRGESRGAEPHTKGKSLMTKLRFVGMDLHAETIAVAVAMSLDAGRYTQRGSFIDCSRRPMHYRNLPPTRKSWRKSAAHHDRQLT